jgi:hypothetical protein
VAGFIIVSASREYFLNGVFLVKGMGSTRSTKDRLLFQALVNHIQWKLGLLINLICLITETLTVIDSLFSGIHDIFEEFYDLP